MRGPRSELRTTPFPLRDLLLETRHQSWTSTKWEVAGAQGLVRPWAWSHKLRPRRWRPRCHCLPRRMRRPPCHHVPSQRRLRQDLRRLDRLRVTSVLRSGPGVRGWHSCWRGGLRWSGPRRPSFLATSSKDRSAPRLRLPAASLRPFNRRRLGEPRGRYVWAMWLWIVVHVARRSCFSWVRVPSSTWFYILAYPRSSWPSRHRANPPVTCFRKTGVPWARAVRRATSSRCKPCLRAAAGTLGRLVRRSCASARHRFPRRGRPPGCISSRMRLPASTE